MSISASPLSNSYMPTSNMPTTVKLFRRGSVPAGGHLPCGVMTTTVSPMPHAERAGELAAEHDAELAGLEVRERARAHVPADVGDRVLLRRIDAADQRAAVGRRRPTASPARARRAPRP